MGLAGAAELFLVMNQARCSRAILDLIGPSLRAIPGSETRVTTIRADSQGAVDADVVHAAGSLAERARCPLGVFLSPEIHTAASLDGLHVIRHAGFGRQLVYSEYVPTLYERLYRVVTSEHSGKPQQRPHAERERYADRQYCEGNAEDHGRCSEDVGNAGGQRHGVPTGRPARS